MLDAELLDFNRSYWNTAADDWVGVTALPEYGTEFVTEEELQLFGDVTGKKLLEVCCGSGHSLQYQARNGAGELWGIDISDHQLEHARQLLSSHGISANLLCSPMEADCGLPQDYFDIVYSIYGIGWSTDLLGTFRRIASYLRKDGIFIFSWKHPFSGCTGIGNNGVQIEHSYFNESWDTYVIDGVPMKLANRKISTYINALAEAGFIIETMVEQTSDAVLQKTEGLTERNQKAQLVPLSFIFRVRKV